MQTVHDPAQAQALLHGLRARGQRIGVVPTMGFLHAGHASLMRLARSRCDQLVVSSFVNPLQFGPGEDLERYPRDPQGDADLCEQAGVDLFFMPPTLYAPGHASAVHVQGLTAGLCGASRPGHFDGVTTVVARLFGLLQPDLAVFGEKDYQQLAVVRRMAADLYPSVQVLGGPLIRDDDGLALSSRNAYLSPEERQRALSLSAALRAMQAQAQQGERRVPALIETGRALLQVDSLDYFEVVDPDSLTPLVLLDAPARALVAGRVGRTRLIDNLQLGA